MMSATRLAVVGGGQMGRALVGGMVADGVWEAKQIEVVEPNAECVNWWREHHPSIRIGRDLSDVVKACDTVILAVKPNTLKAVAEQGHGTWGDRLIISIAAGVSLRRLSRDFGHARIVRVMPNTPCLVRSGVSAYCCGDGVTAADVASVERMLAAVGMVVPVVESQMDAVTGLSGSGPAYLFIAIEALSDGGVAEGLPRPLATKLAAQTVFGAAKLVLEDSRHPAELKDAVASPGGTTIAGLNALEHNGFRAALIAAVSAATRRSRELEPPEPLT